MKQEEADFPSDLTLEADGTKRWYRSNTNIPHRLDGPAVEYANGDREWWVNGKQHRLDGPAVESADGGKFWGVNGLRHRLDGPAVEFAGGDKEWWVNDHRIDGFVLALFKQAVSDTTTSSKLRELSHHENSMVAQAAAYNPNCPLEAQIEWALIRGGAENETI